MCKVGPAKSRAGVLARIYNLKDRVPGLANDGSPRKYGADCEDEEGDAASPAVAPVLRVLSPDLLTQACCWLDAKSLATVCAVSRGMLEVGRASYPWRLLCSREWELQEEEHATGQPVRREFRDDIFGQDFRKLFPLIEEMPRGFDCSLLRPAPEDGGDGDEDVDDDDDDSDGDFQLGAHADGGNALADQGEGAGEGYAAAHGGQLGAAGQAGNQQGIAGGAARQNGDGRRGGRAGRNPAMAFSGEGTGDDWEEEDIGGFWVKKIRRVRTGAGRRDRGRVEDRRRDLAIEVEFHGGVGVGNRCVRADLPLPSTILRERKGLAARSHLARHLGATPLALLRWILAKMAATAAGAGGGVARTRSGVAAAAAAFLATSVAHSYFDEGGGDGEEEQADGVETGGVVPDMDNGEPIEGHGVDGGELGLIRASVPGGPAGSSRRGAGCRDEEPLPRPFCYPVCLGGGVLDVTPRLVSYFEVTIGYPRSTPEHTIPDCVAVGLSDARFSLKGKMPGWDAASYGYHSDDGGAFHDAGSMLFKCGPSFGAGDVVGCGLDYSVGDDSADIFFTLNGRSLGGAFHGVRGSFYPTVGVDSACPVRLNVGAEPFVFDLTAALREGGQEAAAREALTRGGEMASCLAPAEEIRGDGVTHRAASTSFPRTSSRPRQVSLPVPGIFRPFGVSPVIRVVPT